MFTGDSSPGSTGKEERGYQALPYPCHTESHFYSRQLLVPGLFHMLWSYMRCVVLNLWSFKVILVFII